MRIPSTDSGISARGAEELLAHALELTHDSIDRYRQLRDSVEVHHNQHAALVLTRIIELALEHAATISRQLAAERLPKIAPWELQWRCPGLLSGRQQTGAGSQCDHQMSPIQVLQLALRHERCAQEHYLAALTDATLPEAKQILETIARLQAQQIARLEALHATTAPTQRHREDDLDPPQRPE